MKKSFAWLMMILLVISVTGCKPENHISEPLTNIPSENSTSPLSPQISQSEIEIGDFKWHDHQTWEKILLDCHQVIGLPLEANRIVQHGDFYKELCSVLVPYMTTNAYHNLVYPDVPLDSQMNLLYFIVFGLERNYLPAPFNVQDFLDPQTGFYTIPAELLDIVMDAYLKDPKLDTDYLVKRGYMLPDKSAYAIRLNGFGLGNFLNIKDVEHLENNQLKVIIDVFAYHSDAEPLMAIHYIFDTSENHLRFARIHAEYY